MWNVIDAQHNRRAVNSQLITAHTYQISHKQHYNALEDEVSLSIVVSWMVNKSFVTTLTENDILFMMIINV
jgi:hypothetical protein